MPLSSVSDLEELQNTTIFSNSYRPYRKINAFNSPIIGSIHVFLEMSFGSSYCPQYSETLKKLLMTTASR